MGRPRKPTPPESGVGMKVPGSVYYRDYCARCGEAIRVIWPQIGGSNWCHECDENVERTAFDRWDALTPRQKDKLRSSDNAGKDNYE